MPESASRGGRGGVPGWGGGSGVPGWGGVPGPGGVVVCLVGGVPGPGGVCLSDLWDTTPPVNRMTNRCKNITLATTSLRPVMKTSVPCCTRNNIINLLKYIFLMCIP